MPSINDFFNNNLQMPFRKKATPKLSDKLAPVTPKPSVDKLVLSNPTVHNKVTLHVSPSESHQALLDLIKNSKKSIHIETFIWHNDEAGQDIAKALGDRISLAKKNRKPFDAKVMIDSVGLGAGSGGSEDAAIVDKLKSYGVDVKVFNSKFVSLEAMGVPLTHRKLYIADGEKFITGGRNIGNEYLKEEYTNANGDTEPSWHDLLFTVQGDETNRIEKEFYENWVRAGGKAPGKISAAVPSSDGKARIQSVTTDPNSGDYGIRDAHYQAIRNAKDEIVLMYPYFSDDGLLNELLKAKKANPNLKIKVLLPANKEASHEGSIYSILNKESASQLLKAGAEIRLFEGDKVDGETVMRFSHFKGLLVDNSLLSIGSANGDARTYNANHELNTLIADESTIKNFREKVINPDWASAKRFTIEDTKGGTTMDKVKRGVLEFLDPLL